MFEAENRLFHKHAEAQLKKVRAYKKKSVPPSFLDASIHLLKKLALSICTPFGLLVNTLFFFYKHGLFSAEPQRAYEKACFQPQTCLVRA